MFPCMVAINTCMTNQCLGHVLLTWGKWLLCKILVNQVRYSARAILHLKLIIIIIIIIIINPDKLNQVLHIIIWTCRNCDCICRHLYSGNWLVTFAHACMYTHILTTPLFLMLFHPHHPMFGVREAVVVIHFDPHLTSYDHSSVNYLFNIHYPLSLLLTHDWSCTGGCHDILFQSTQSSCAHTY